MARRSAFEHVRPVRDSSHRTSVPENTAEESEQAEATEPEPQQSPSEPANKQAKKGKVTFYLWPEDRDRAKAAYMHTMGHTNIPSWTQFLETAVREFTHKLEEEHNDRRPFPRPE